MVIFYSYVKLPEGIVGDPPIPIVSPGVKKNGANSSFAYVFPVFFRFFVSK